MADNKKYYWIKLQTDFFNQETIDFLLSQKNGCEYVVLYQMLCLKTANNNGKFATEIGEMIIPYDVEKIVRDTKYFDFDTVTIALGLFKRLGLIYEEENNILRITNFEYMIGSESASRDAEKKRMQRVKKQVRNKSGDNLSHEKGTDCPIEIGDKSGDNLSHEKGTDCPIEIRDKRLEIRDKSIDNNTLLSTDVDKNLQIDYQKILNLFNSVCISLPKVQKLTDLRKQKIRKAHKELNGDFESFFKKIENSDFLTGKNGNWNGCNFDWILKSVNLIKIIEGNYDNKDKNNDNRGDISGIENSTHTWFEKDSIKAKAKAEAESKKGKQPKEEEHQSSYDLSFLDGIGLLD